MAMLSNMWTRVFISNKSTTMMKYYVYGIRTIVEGDTKRTRLPYSRIVLPIVCYAVKGVEHCEAYK